MNQPVYVDTLVDGAVAADYQLLKPTAVPNGLAVLAIGVALLASVYSGWAAHTLPSLAAWFSSLWLLAALGAAVFITPRVFVVGHGLALLGCLVAWRVAAINDAGLQALICGVCTLPLALQFADCALSDYRRNRHRPGAWLNALLWQFTVVRLCFGLNEVCHATEKLFAGAASFQHLQQGFQAVGITQGVAAMVILGGLIELAAAVCVGLGLLARLGAALSLLYLLVATVGFGGEWTRGYAWASAGGGGWEYVMLLLVVFGAVAAVGAGKFSIDGWLLRRGLLRGWASRLSVPAVL